jgi:hypothetical protein
MRPAAVPCKAVPRRFIRHGSALGRRFLRIELWITVGKAAAQSEDSRGRRDFVRPGTLISTGAAGPVRESTTHGITLMIAPVVGYFSDGAACGKVKARFLIA